MARPASGRAVLAQAKAAIAKAQSVEALRMAQAVVLPWELGLTLSQTAAVLGVSPGWVWRLRCRFERITQGEEAPRPKKGGRRRELWRPEQEAALLAPYLEEATAGGVLVVPPIRTALEAHLGRPVALSTVYRMLHRQSWRKVAPDRRHPKADPAAQESWKKNSLRRSLPSSKSSRAPERSG